MIKHYLITALRNISRHRGYSIINMLGLTIGMAAFILILLYVRFQLSYDNFHEKSDRIYRVCLEGEISGEYLHAAVVSAPVGPAMAQKFPEVEAFCRLDKSSESIFFRYGEKALYEEGMLYADSSFFQVFSFRLLRGNPQTALSEPFSLVLSEQMAQRYFGDVDPLGKTIRMNNQHDFRITGVVENAPRNSHFSYEMIGSYTSLISLYGTRYMESWGSFGTSTYVVLSPEAAPQRVDERLPGLMQENMKEVFESLQITINPYLQAITQIHLHSDLVAEIQPTGNMAYVRIFGAVGLFILLIACINYMNLATARSGKRAREVGLRRVVGGNRSQLVQQFLGESVMLSLFALLGALVLVDLFLPSFNDMMDLQLNLDFSQQPVLIPLLLLVVLVVGLVSGSYPAFYLSGFQPIMAIRGARGQRNQLKGLRNGLVVVQFAISVFLMICTGVVYNQLNFIQSKKLGFKKENVMVIPVRGEAMSRNYPMIRNEMQQLSAVVSVAGSSGIPGSGIDGSGYYPEGSDMSHAWIMYNYRTDYHWGETMGLDLLEGRWPSEAYGTDSSAILINQALARKLNWDEPLGKKIFEVAGAEPQPLTVVGMVRDFHIQSLRSQVEPMLLRYHSHEFNYILLRLQAGDLEANIAAVEKKWNQIQAGIPLDFFFLEQNIRQMYQQEVLMGRVFVVFTLIALFIACLGLFGLASFVAEQRTREIGIRKVLGATASGLVIRLNGEFLIWIVVGNLVAIPAAWLVMKYWLESFAYRTEVHLWVILSASLLSSVIALVTVTFQSLRASHANPVEAIKYE